MNEVFLAVVMLTAPVGTPENISEPDFDILHKVIQEKAVEWEIMDSRETRYLLCSYKDFQEDLEVLRKRHQDLQDAPKIAECQLLPERNVVNGLIAFNRSFRKYLESRLEWEFDRADVLSQAIRETDRLYCQWDMIRDARCDFYYISVRRYALKRLKDSKSGIGEANFLTGKMPDYVPQWAFSNR